MVAALVASCALMGHLPFIRPDQACTPGDYDKLTTAQVCTSKDRPALPAAERRRILVNYGFNPATWTGKSGELDHRVPVFLGGRTDARNIWPEPEPVFNTKDRLEVYVQRRICSSHTMRAGYARHIFMGNWVLYYNRYLGGIPR